MVSCTGRVTADTNVHTMNVSMMTMPMMTMMYLPTTVASIPSGSTLSGSGPVDHNAEGPSVNVSGTMSLININYLQRRKKRDELRTKPSEAAARSST